jgi:hypothetical protein
MRVAVAVAAGLSALALAACGPGGPGDDDGDDQGNPVLALAVSPPSVTLQSVNQTPVMQDFMVRATYMDGSIADVTALVAWDVPGIFGSFQGARFTSPGTVGGVATATASLDGVAGTAQITIDIQNVRVDPSAPGNAADLFAGGTVDPARAPLINYPQDQVAVPINLGDFDVHWQDGVNDVWEVSLKSAHTDIRVYIGASANRWVTFTAAEWAMAATAQDAVTANVRGVSTALPGVIGVADVKNVVLTDQPTMGGLYYWAATAQSGVDGIFRHDLSRPGQPAEEFYTRTQTGGTCVACHVLSRDGTKMAVTYNGGDGPGTLMDVATRTTVPSPGNWNFGTYTPSGDRFIAGMSGYLQIRESVSGAHQGDIPTGQFATQPDFSPTGNVIAYVGVPGRAVPSYNVSFAGGTIVVQPYDATSGTYAAPQTIVPSAGPNNYYPSVSPDGAWVVFNRSTGDSYDDPDAELWVVPTTGGTPLQLASANIATGLTNSWTRWAPFEQTMNGERMFWLTFSSKRAFGNRMGGGRPQIWMAAFFPDRAMAGMDPTAPAFWLPFQDLSSNNHIAQWTEQIIAIE